ncbi:MAG TPA: single-stranded-DNA-specific exonuclease RecJ [Candidatus Magasanikbacteria bacterium]|nr:single-stranded-DNA-specific exonuclease RecJ [Candidatus Magasanikbacteria bacterium]
MQKKWELLPEPPQDFFEQFPELPKIVACLLYHRNIRTQEKIDEFLNPDYSQDIHDPFLFRDMTKAVERIFEAIKKQEKIVVHGDYDADGVSASVIILSTLKALGHTNYEVFIPHREIDGYGLNMNTVKQLADKKTNLLITCDCGISNTKEITYACALGIDVIITDHHTVPELLPPAHAIIHPGVPGEIYPDKGLAGGGVAFKLIQALLKKHKETNSVLPNNDTQESHEKWLLDMVAIATVGDMVPLIGESRTLTLYGLIVLNKTRRMGLQKLLLEARLMQEDGTKKRDFDTYTIGFQIAPRINAAGRMDHANVAYNLMMTQDASTAAELAYQLDKNNQDRQKTTDALVKEALKQIELETIRQPVLFVLGQGWSTGLVGLIAGKLKEKYYKPAIVMAENNGEITGSGRSIEGFNLVESLQSMPDCFTKFGGHPMACGFTLVQGKLEEFKQNLISKFEQKTTNMNLTPTLHIDAQIQLEDANWGLYDILQKFEPFGQANEKPKYLAKNVEIHKLEPVGKDNKHLRIIIRNGEKTRKTIGWGLCNDNGTNWCKELKPGDIIDLVFEMDINEWNGNRELQLTIVDLKKSI